MKFAPGARFSARCAKRLQRFKANKGAGLRFLTETVTSPTLHGQLQRLLAEFPSAKWHQYEPVNRDSSATGAQLAFGTNVATRYDFEKANVVRLSRCRLPIRLARAGCAMPGTSRHVARSAGASTR